MLVVLLSVFAIFALVACGENKKEEEGNTNDEVSNDTEEEVEEEDTRPVESDEPLEGLDVHFIDSGQNDNILIRSAETTIVVSTNTNGWVEQDESPVPYLESELVGDIDILISTSGDSERHDFTADVLENFTVKEFWSPNYNNNSETGDRVQSALDKQGISQYTPLEGGTTTVGDIDLEVIKSPEPGGDDIYDTLIFKVKYGDVSYLITGYIITSEMKTLLKKDVDLEATILHVPSTEHTKSIELSKEVNPRVVTINSDEKSVHPTPHLIDALDDAGIDEYGTLGHGTIIISTDGESYYIETEKEPEIVDPYNRPEGHKKRSLKSIK